jgi:hypothetical protein
MARLITTYDEVVHVLGGASAVGRLTGRSCAAVCNWRREYGTFPTKLYVLMTAELMRRGFRADPMLWGFEKAARVRKQLQRAAA